jgi:hypothetical protein
VRGYEPLHSDTLPKMPWIRGIVPSETEPVISVGTNPVGPTPVFWFRVGTVFGARHNSLKDLSSNMKKTGPPKGESPSQLIDARIKELGDWRGETLSRIRALIKQADPDVVEEWKWSGMVWSHSGLICTGETYKNAVKMTFPKGASLRDPSGLFNSSLEGNVRRAIDFHEGDKVDGEALKALVREAVALNASTKRV